MSIKVVEFWGGRDCSVCDVMTQQFLDAGFGVDKYDIKVLIDYDDSFPHISRELRQEVIDQLDQQNGAMPVVVLDGKVLPMKEAHKLI